MGKALHGPVLTKTCFAPKRLVINVVQDMAQETFTCLARHHNVHHCVVKQ